MLCFVTQRSGICAEAASEWRRGEVKGEMARDCLISGVT